MSTNKHGLASGVMGPVSWNWCSSPGCRSQSVVFLSFESGGTCRQMLRGFHSTILAFECQAEPCSDLRHFAFARAFTRESVAQCRNHSIESNRIVAITSMFGKLPQVRQLVSEYTLDQVYDFVLAHAQEHLGLQKMFVKQ